MAYRKGESAAGNGYEARERNDEDEEGCDEAFSSKGANEKLTDSRTANPQDTCGRNNDETVESAMKQHKGSHGE